MDHPQTIQTHLQPTINITPIKPRALQWIKISDGRTLKMTIKDNPEQTFSISLFET